VSTDTRKQSLRYLVAGAVCAIANNGLFIAGARAGIGLFGLTLLSFLIVGTMGYIVHARFTFRQAPSVQTYAKFMVGVALGTPVAYIVLALLRIGAHMPMPVAAPVATVILLIYNFAIARLAIVRRLFG
jgi:putative flippase GtrA